MDSEDIAASRIIFRGTNSDECEDFISAVRLKALAENKHRDNQWIAYFASSCFVGDALYWYESLDESIQEDWKQLRPALLERFGRKSRPATSPSSPSIHPSSVLLNTIPTPAAAPPVKSPLSSLLPRRGRLKVLSRSGAFRGYLGAAATTFGLYNHVERSSNDALSIELTSSSTYDVQEIVISGNDSLAATWVGASLQWVKGTRSAAACCSWSKTTSVTKWQTEKRIWTVSGENEVSAKYPNPNGGAELLRPCIDHNGGFLRWVGTSNEGYGYEFVKVVFEESS